MLLAVIIISIQCVTSERELPILRKPHENPNARGLKCWARKMEYGVNIPYDFNTRFIRKYPADTPRFWYGDNLVITAGAYAELDMRDVFTHELISGWWKLKFTVKIGKKEGYVASYFPLMETRLMGGYNWTVKNSVENHAEGDEHIARFEFWFKGQLDPKNNFNRTLDPILVAGPDLNNKGVMETGLGYDKEYKAADDMIFFFRNWNPVVYNNKLIKNSSEIYLFVEIERILPFWDNVWFKPAQKNPELAIFHNSQKEEIESAFRDFQKNIKRKDFLESLYSEEMIEFSKKYFNLPYGEGPYYKNREALLLLSMMQGLHMMTTNENKPADTDSTGKIITGNNVVMFKSKVNYDTWKDACNKEDGVLVCDCETSHAWNLGYSDNPGMIYWEGWHLDKADNCKYSFKKSEKEIEIFRIYMLRSFEGSGFPEGPDALKVIEKVIEKYKHYRGK